MGGISEVFQDYWGPQERCCMGDSAVLRGGVLLREASDLSQCSSPLQLCPASLCPFPPFSLHFPLIIILSIPIILSSVSFSSASPSTFPLSFHHSPTPICPPLHPRWCQVQPHCNTPETSSRGSHNTSSQKLACREKSLKSPIMPAHCRPSPWLPPSHASRPHSGALTP